MTENKLSTQLSSNSTFLYSNDDYKFQNTPTVHKIPQDNTKCNTISLYTRSITLHL